MAKRGAIKESLPGIAMMPLCEAPASAGALFALNTVMFGVRGGMYKVEQRWGIKSYWVVTVLLEKSFLAHELGTTFPTREAALAYMAERAPKLKHEEVDRFNQLESNFRRLAHIPRSSH